MTSTEQNLLRKYRINKNIQKRGSSDCYSDLTLKSL